MTNRRERAGAMIKAIRVETKRSPYKVVVGLFCKPNRCQTKTICLISSKARFPTMPCLYTILIAFLFFAYNVLLHTLKWKPFSTVIDDLNTLEGAGEKTKGEQARPTPDEIKKLLVQNTVPDPKLKGWFSHNNYLTSKLPSCLTHESAARVWKGGVYVCVCVCGGGGGGGGGV